MAPFMRGVMGKRMESGGVRRGGGKQRKRFRTPLFFLGSPQRFHDPPLSCFFLKQGHPLKPLKPLAHARPWPDGGMVAEGEGPGRRRPFQVLGRQCLQHPHRAGPGVASGGEEGGGVLEHG